MAKQFESRAEFYNAWTELCALLEERFGLNDSEVRELTAGMSDALRDLCGNPQE